MSFAKLKKQMKKLEQRIHETCFYCGKVVGMKEKVRHYYYPEVCQDLQNNEVSRGTVKNDF